MTAEASDVPVPVQRVTVCADPKPSPTDPPVPGPAPSHRPSWVTATEELRVKLQPATTSCSWFVPDPIPEVKLSATLSAWVRLGLNATNAAKIKGLNRRNGGFVFMGFAGWARIHPRP